MPDLHALPADIFVRMSERGANLMPPKHSAQFYRVCPCVSGHRCHLSAWRLWLVSRAAVELRRGVCRGTPPLHLAAGVGMKHVTDM